MSGENYAIVGCSANHRYKDISLFILETSKSNYNINMSWKKC